jgi:probable addiction module antidote protein
MTVEFARYDASDYLDNEEVIAEYLSAAAEDPNPDVLLRARDNVAKARMIGHVSRNAGRGRGSVYNDHGVAIVSVVIIAAAMVLLILVFGLIS